jgi:hypothetical protein
LTLSAGIIVVQRQSTLATAAISDNHQTIRPPLLIVIDAPLALSSKLSRHNLPKGDLVDGLSGLRGLSFPPSCHPNYRNS